MDGRTDGRTDGRRFLSFLRFLHAPLHLSPPSSSLVQLAPLVRRPTRASHEELDRVYYRVIKNRGGQRWKNIWPRLGGGVTCGFVTSFFGVVNPAWSRARTLH